MTSSIYEQDRLLKELPPPSEEARQHSSKLVEHIKTQIKKAGGSIPFFRFMELALYTPGLGYYSGGSAKFGQEGDFITAPELSPLFAACLARQCQQLFDALGRNTMLEVGGGSGALATDLLLSLESLNCLPDHYFILELSAELRQRQQQQLNARAAHLADKVQWLDRLPDNGFEGVVIGNEVLDAMPVERFCVTDQGVQRQGVRWIDEQGFDWTTMPPTDAISARAATLGLEPGYCSEINLAAEAWVRSAADCLRQGVIILIDYGFPQNEFYLADRYMGTLMCHYRHRSHSNPLVLAGLQDITAHVDFTAIAECAVESGLELLGYTSQAAFLLGNGLMDMAASSDANDTRSHIEMTQQIKKLTLPSEMGELFKVIAFGRFSDRQMDLPLQGFQLQDRRHRL